MTNKFILFDMDGVLLEPSGYINSLQSAVQRVGKALGAPNTILTKEQILWFDAHDITNEWDSLAICTAMILLLVWQSAPEVRLKNPTRAAATITQESPAFDAFLRTFTLDSDLPGESAFRYLIQKNAWLNQKQKEHLKIILFTCRDIFRSPILPIYQETVLGSDFFQENYQLDSQLDIESYLLKFDRPVLRDKKYQGLLKWHQKNNHHMGIMTNRPSASPPGYISSPEAELAAKLVNLEFLPLLGSGKLAWYATTHCDLPEHTFLKPNPVHALALIQMCLGHSFIEAMQLGIALWQEQAQRSDWQALKDANLIIVEDAVKGLQSGQKACELINQMDINTSVTLIGIATNAEKQKALDQIADFTVDSIDDIEWNDL